MKTKIKFKINILNLLNAITALLLVLNCQSVYQNAKNINFHIYELCLLFIILDSFAIIFKYGISSKNKQNFLAVSLIYCMAIIIYIIFSVNADNLVRFLSRFIVFPFVLMYFFSSAPEKVKYNIFRYFVEWVVIISVVTSALWFLSTFWGLRSTSNFIWEWPGDVYGSSYYNLYFSSPYQYIDFIPGLVMRRNIGIFTEGPMFMIVLSLALCFSYLFKAFFSIKRWKIIAMTIAMITTFSVTGYIVGFIILAVAMINKNKKAQNKIILLLLFSCAGLIAGSIITEMKSSTASYAIRIDDFLTGIKAFISSPIVGVGYENVNTLKSYMSSFRSYNTGFSNTLFSVLAYGGLLLTSIYVFPIIMGTYKAMRRHDMSIFLFCILYVILYCSVIFYTFYINFFVWAFLISYIINGRNKHISSYCNGK